MSGFGPIDHVNFNKLIFTKGSIFDNDPSKFDYIVEKNDTWKNTKTHLTSEIVDNLILEYARKRKKIKPFNASYNTIKNLGYSDEEMKNLNLKDKDDVLEIKNRRDKKVLEYKNKILEEK